MMEAYSIPDLTKAMYASFLQSAGAPRRLRRMNPSFCAALDETCGLFHKAG